MKTLEKIIRAAGYLAVLLLAVGFGVAFSGNQDTGGLIACIGGLFGLLFFVAGFLFLLHEAESR